MHRFVGTCHFQEHPSQQEAINFLAPCVTDWGNDKASEVFNPNTLDKMRCFLGDERKIFKDYSEWQVTDARIVPVTDLPHRIQAYQKAVRDLTQNHSNHEKGHESHNSLADFLDLNPEDTKWDSFRDNNIFYFSYYSVQGSAGQGKLLLKRLDNDESQVAVTLNLSLCSFELAQSSLGRGWRWATGGKMALPKESKEMVCNRAMMKLLMGMKGEGLLQQVSAIPDGGSGKHALQTAIGISYEDKEAEALRETNHTERQDICIADD